MVAQSINTIVAVWDWTCSWTQYEAKKAFRSLSFRLIHLGHFGMPNVDCIPIMHWSNIVIIEQNWTTLM